MSLTDMAIRATPDYESVNHHARYSQLFPPPRVKPAGEGVKQRLRRNFHGKA